MSVQNFEEKNFEEKVLKSKKPVVVDFWAVWCPPCRMASPIIDELAEEYKDKAVIGKVDVDQAPNLAEKYKISSVPTVVMFKDGREVDRVVGFPGREAYQTLIKKVI